MQVNLKKQVSDPNTNNNEAKRKYAENDGAQFYTGSGNGGAS
jgi:hypothetical protein